MKYLIILSLMLTSFNSYTQNNVEYQAVESACLDYIHTFYNADTTLAYKSIHQSLRKTGFYFDKKTDKYSDQLEMPFKDLIALAKRWNADGSKVNEESVKEVEVFEVSDKTAVAKVTAVWGIDYISLMKMEDSWMIVNVLWQTPPKE